MEPLSRLAETGVNGVVLAVKHMAQVFMQRYGDSQDGLTISLFHRKKAHVDRRSHQVR